MRTALPYGQLPRFRATTPSNKEAIQQPLYDILDYAAAGQQSLTFFQIPVSGTKTLARTNMRLAGTLSAGMSMLVQAIELVFIPGGLINTFGAPAAPTFADDVHAFFKGGHIRFNYFNKPYLDEAPIGVIGQSFGIDVSAALSDSSTIAANQSIRVEYASLHKRVYRINPITIMPQQNFDVTMDWPEGVVALPSGNAAKVGVRLLGTQYRDSQ